MGLGVLGGWVGLIGWSSQNATDRWLKQQKFISLSSGVWKFKIKVLAHGWFLLRFLSLARRQPPSCCLPARPFLCVCIPGVSVLISFYKSQLLD